MPSKQYPDVYSYSYHPLLQIWKLSGKGPAQVHMANTQGAQGLCFSLAIPDLERVHAGLPTTSLARLWAFVAFVALSCPVHPLGTAMS